MKGTKPSIVFCHGIWADGSCFSKVIPALQAEGHQRIAAQYSLDTTEEDVATVKLTLGRVNTLYSLKIRMSAPTAIRNPVPALLCCAPVETRRFIVVIRWVIATAS